MGAMGPGSGEYTRERLVCIDPRGRGPWANPQLIHRSETINVGYYETINETIARNIARIC